MRRAPRRRASQMRRLGRKPCASSSSPPRAPARRGGAMRAWATMWRARCRRRPLPTAVPARRIRPRGVEARVARSLSCSRRSSSILAQSPKPAGRRQRPAPTGDAARRRRPTSRDSDGGRRRTVRRPLARRPASLDRRLGAAPVLARVDNRRVPTLRRYRNELGGGELTPVPAARSGARLRPVARHPGSRGGRDHRDRRARRGLNDEAVSGGTSRSGRPSSTKGAAPASDPAPTASPAGRRHQPRARPCDAVQRLCGF